MPRERFPLVGSLTNRNVNPSSFSTKDQIFENCFPEIYKNPATGKGSVYLNKRPGAAATSAFGQAELRGSRAACQWTGAATPRAVLAFGDSVNSVVEIWDTTPTQVGGDIANTIACVSLTETLISGTPNLVAIVLETTGTNPLEAWFFPEGGAWTQITDADFPPNIATPVPITRHDPAFLDGFMFVMTQSGLIYNSDVNSLSAWTAGNSIAVQSMPDQGVGVARYRNTIAAFGKNSIEFFHNASNATGSPLSRVDSAALRIGADAPSSDIHRVIQTVANTIYWIGHDSDSGTLGVYRLNGFAAEKVSTPFVDKLLADAVIDNISGVMTILGQTHVVFGTETDTSWSFAIDTGFWWKLTVTGVGATTGIRACVGFKGDSYFTSGNTRQVHSFGTAIYQDDGSAYTMTVQTDNRDEGTHKRKFYKRLSLVGDTQSAASAVGVSFSDDDYANFSTARNIDMNTTQRSLFALGSARRRAWKFTHAANTPCRIEAVEIEYDEGSH